MEIVKAIHEKENRNNKFLAAIQGIDVDADPKEKVEEDNDIANLKGWKAQKEGFGIGQGLGYVSQGG
ncbi:MAG: hypothetical protein EB127_01885 [Alphaproteobacteria bacterium]|nr:hypothetical protein [Alphaproteobacteria bacterium]